MNRADAERMIEFLKLADNYIIQFSELARLIEDERTRKPLLIATVEIVSDIHEKLRRQILRSYPDLNTDLDINKKDHECD